MMEENTAPESAPNESPIPGTMPGGLVVIMPPQPDDEETAVALPLDAPRDPFAHKALIDVQESSDETPRDETPGDETPGEAP